MIQKVCFICDKLRASRMSATRSIYHDVNGSMSLNLRVDPETEDRVYSIKAEHYVGDKLESHTVIVCYCPFCGKELT